MAYFILAARDTTGAPYHVAFGDYDRATVSQEASDLAYGRDYRRADMKVIKIGRATQRAVDAALAELNAAASRAIAAQSV